MTSLGRLFALTAGFAVGAANPAVADATLTFAEGTGEEGDRVRMIAGDIDGKGVLYAEYYTGAALRMAVPYTLLYVDGEKTELRSLRDLTMQRQTAEGGFAFTAMQGSAQLQCTALLWADTSVNCVRDPSWVPNYSPACVAGFQSNAERHQCDGLRAHWTNPVIGHDELLRACTRAFRVESTRTACLRNGYDRPKLFHETLDACVAAYRTQDERKFCMFYSFSPAELKDRPDVSLIRACDRLHDDDRATTLCVFEKHTGKKQVTPKGRAPLPTDDPTAPLARNTALPKRLRGGPLEVSTGGAFHELALRATGGMVETEPVLWVDAYAANGELRWMQPVDRIVVGKQVRALREVEKLDRIRLNGQTLTFRAVLRGKPLTCHGDATDMFARCR